MNPDTRKLAAETPAESAASFARYAALADTVRRCEAQGTPLCIRGGATLSAEPASGRTMLEIAPLNQLVAHARDDMTVTVEAGMTVAAMQAQLGGAGQQLPLDVPFAERATVGGLIATNLAGPRRFSRGGVRDLLLGVTIVGRGGDVFRGGGRVVKNVAGYDLCKLYTGSWGWLGAIVEATFRVVPTPEMCAATVLPIPDAAEAEAQVATLLRGPLRPASIDLLSEATGRRLGFSHAGLTLVIGFEGLREEVESGLAPWGGGSEAGPSRTAILSDASYRAYCAAAVEAVLTAECPVRFGLPSAAVAGWLAHVSERSPAALLLSHVPDGVVWGGFGCAQVAALRAACAEVASLGGSWLLLRGGVAECAELPMLGPPRNDWALMRRVKAALDPAHVFGRDGAFDRAIRANGA